MKIKIPLIIIILLLAFSVWAVPNCQNTSTGNVPLYPSSLTPVIADTIPADAIIAGFGMSNAFQEYKIFPGIRNCAIGGGTVNHLANSNWSKWDRIMDRCGNANQVTDVLFKVAVGGKSKLSQSSYINFVVDSTYGAMDEIKRRFPNVVRWHLWSRIYGEYADDKNQSKSSEPQAYWTGHAVDLVVAQTPNAYWASYVWADGLNPRTDGLIWACNDFRDDGLHPNSNGVQKVLNWGLTPWLDKAMGGQSTPPPNPQQCVPTGTQTKCKIRNNGECVCI